MKNAIVFVLLLVALPVFSQVLEGGVDFDWISKTQLQRDENISQIQNLLVKESVVAKYSKKEFRQMHADFFKDKEHFKNYEEISNGKKSDDEKTYCGFFLKSGLLIAYGIQYKNNLNHIYYYDAMGNLRWLDTFSGNYPKFPYFSYQYDRSGNLVAAYYYISDIDQYVFSPEKKFVGRWYKEKMYNKNAKVIMTRSNY